MPKTPFEGLIRRPFTATLPAAPDPDLAAMPQALDTRARRRLADAGSCNACELELNALGNPFYDLECFGLRFVVSPRHAGVLIVTGSVAKTCARHCCASTTRRPR